MKLTLCVINKTTKKDKSVTNYQSLVTDNTRKIRYFSCVKNIKIKFNFMKVYQLFAIMKKKMAFIKIQFSYRFGNLINKIMMIVIILMIIMMLDDDDDDNKNYIRTTYF